MATLFTSSSIDVFRAVLIRHYSVEFKSANEDRYTTTSPYALTTDIPTLRIVDNAITKGGWASSTSSIPHYGFFGGFKGAETTSEGGGSVDTTIQFDRILKCPVTGREFLEKDMKKYQDQIYAECRYYAEEKADGAQITDNPANRTMLLKTWDNRAVEFTLDILISVGTEKMPDALYRIIHEALTTPRA